MVNRKQDITTPIIPFITAASATVQGKRQENQDAHLITYHNNLASFVVADGAGGHELGKYASSLTVRSLEAEFKSANISYDSFKKIIQKKYDQINTHIFQEGSKKGIVMATTLAMLNITGDKALISNIGDTTIYLLRNQILTALTEAHTVAWELFRNDAIKRDEIQAHHQAHVLTKAIGATESVEPFVTELTVKPNDLYLICSDGLYNHVSEERIVEKFSRQDHYQQKELEKLCEQSIAEALGNGSNDNITMIALQISKVE